MHAIILAGGLGTRLEPLTASTPKPLLRLGQLSVLEIALRQLQACGFTRVTLCVSYRGDDIRREFGDGDRLGLSVDYSWDHEPSGTAGPLLSAPGWETPALVMNGDILTTLNFAALFEAHREHGGVMTVVTRRCHVPIEFGVLELTDGRVCGIREKPELAIDTAAGIEVIDPEARTWLPDGSHLDMPTLIESLIAQGQDVHAYPFAGPWHDIGTPSNYESARTDFIADPARYLPAGTPLPVTELLSRL